MEDENFQKINIFKLWSLHCLFMNVNSLWLAKSIEKYYSWFWSSIVKILDLSLVVVDERVLPRTGNYLVPGL